MAFTKGRRRSTCHHEAGHVLARWYFGHFTYRVHVLKIDQVMNSIPIVDRQGRIHYAEGLMESYDICSRRFRLVDRAYIIASHGPEVGRDFDMAPQVEMIECYAGAYAEAQYTGDNVDDIILTGGEKDEAMALELADRWTENEIKRNRMIIKARQRAEALVSSKKARLALSGMAQTLFRHGKVYGDVLEKVCEDAYQTAPALCSWRSHWPPTLTQLRSGFVPESQA